MGTLLTESQLAAATVKIEYFRTFCLLVHVSFCKMSDLEINGTPIAKLRVVDLKNELDARGLSKSGKKDELVVRLISYIEAENHTAATAAASEDVEMPAGGDNEVTEAENDSENGGTIAEVATENTKEQEEIFAEEDAKLKAEKAVEEAAERAREQKVKLAEEAAEKAKEQEEAKAEKARKEEKKLAAEKLTIEEEKSKRKIVEDKKTDELQLKEEKERLRKEEEEKKTKEEERKRKDLEERKRLEAHEHQMEEEKKKKDEDRKRIKEETELKRKGEIEKEAEKNKATAAEKEKLKADQRAKYEKEHEDRKSEEEKIKAAKETQNEETKENSDNKRDEADVGINGKEDESLIIETAADDTLVMEIDQADIVAEEVSKEESESPMISAEPGQVTSLRRLGGSKSGLDTSRKRGWGASRGSTASANSVTISSNSLKDLVPDIKPLLDTEATIEEEVEECSVDSDADIAGPKIPDNVKKDAEPVKKRKRIPVTDLNETAVVLIINLTRPFTVNQLKEMLKRTGTIVDFWIDRIKSMCCVQFSTVDQASETRMALDGVTWPQGNPKTLRVTFSTEEELKKHQESSTDALSRLGTDSNGRLGGVREWDKNKLDQEQDRAKERERRLVREKERREGQEREKSVEKKPAAVKSLEDLFKKTVAGPAIYWKPLSEDQIKQKIEARNKKIMEAQIMREMMDTKESLQRSKKLLPARSPHD